MWSPAVRTSTRAGAVPPTRCSPSRSRDGDINELLAEADRPDRRFNYVICESIERIARRTYIGTDIENRLERAGVRLLAADEPFSLAPNGGRKAKRATQLLTRRVKQGIAEFYVIEMLEKSWDGFAVHTEQGFNIGKPCYGHRAARSHTPSPRSERRARRRPSSNPTLRRRPSSGGSSPGGSTSGRATR